MTCLFNAYVSWKRAGLATANLCCYCGVEYPLPYAQKTFPTQHTCSGCHLICVRVHPRWFPCSALNSSCGKPLTLLHLVSNSNTFYISIYYVWTLKISTRGRFFPTPPSQPAAQSACRRPRFDINRLLSYQGPWNRRHWRGGRPQTQGLSLLPGKQAPSVMMLRETFIITRLFVKKAILTNVNFSVKVFQLQGWKLPQKNFHSRIFSVLNILKNPFQCFIEPASFFVICIFFYIFHSMLVEVRCNKLPSAWPIMN